MRLLLILVSTLSVVSTALAGPLDVSSRLTCQAQSISKANPFPTEFNESNPIVEISIEKFVLGSKELIGPATLQGAGMASYEYELNLESGGTIRLELGDESGGGLGAPSSRQGSFWYFDGRNPVEQVAHVTCSQAE